MEVPDRVYVSPLQVPSAQRKGAVAQECTSASALHRVRQAVRFLHAGSNAHGCCPTLLPTWHGSVVPQRRHDGHPRRDDVGLDAAVGQRAVGGEGGHVECAGKRLGQVAGSKQGALGNGRREGLSPNSGKESSTAQAYVLRQQCYMIRNSVCRASPLYTRAQALAAPARGRWSSARSEWRCRRSTARSAAG